MANRKSAAGVAMGMLGRRKPDKARARLVTTAERMMRIHERINRGGYPNCTTMGKEIGVSARTVKRDLDFMRYRLDLPIKYEPRRNGYYYTAKVKRLPGVHVTEADRFALLVAQKAMTPYRGRRGRRG